MARDGLTLSKLARYFKFFVFKYTTLCVRKFTKGILTHFLSCRDSNLFTVYHRYVRLATERGYLLPRRIICIKLKVEALFVNMIYGWH